MQLLLWALTFRRFLGYDALNYIKHFLSISYFLCGYLYYLASCLPLYLQMSSKDGKDVIKLCDLGISKREVDIVLSKAGQLPLRECPIPPN